MDEYLLQEHQNLFEEDELSEAALRADEIPVIDISKKRTMKANIVRSERE